MAVMDGIKEDPGTGLSVGLTWLPSCFSQLNSVFCSSSLVCSLLATLPVPNTLLPRVLCSDHGHVEQVRLDSVWALVLRSPYYSVGIWTSHRSESHLA